MVAYARRVVDEDGEDVTAAWVHDSNEHLQEKLEKQRARTRSRRRAQPRPAPTRLGMGQSWD